MGNVEATSEHLTPTMPDFKVPVLDDEMLLQVFKGNGLLAPSSDLALRFCSNTTPPFCRQQREIADARAVKNFRKEREALKAMRADEARAREQTKVRLRGLGLLTYFTRLAAHIIRAGTGGPSHGHCQCSEGCSGEGTGVWNAAQAVPREGACGTRGGAKSRRGAARCRGGSTAGRGRQQQERQEEEVKQASATAAPGTPRRGVQTPAPVSHIINGHCLY